MLHLLYVFRYVIGSYIVFFFFFNSSVAILVILKMGFKGVRISCPTSSHFKLIIVVGIRICLASKDSGWLSTGHSQHPLSGWMGIALNDHVGTIDASHCR